MEDNEVVKIFEFSTKASESQRVELCRSLQERLEIAQKYLAKYLTETHISIESHPISGLRCVIIRQPYIKGRLLLKQPYGAFLTTKQSINYFELLTSALRLYEEQNYLLDVNQSNLVVKGDRVLVLDTILIGTVDVIMFPRTLKVLKKELNYIKQTTAIKEVAK